MQLRAGIISGMIAILGSSCTKEEVDLLQNSSLDKKEELVIPYNEGGKMELGNQLPNPYSVASMKEALAALQKAGRSESDTVNIETTHYYVRFLARDSIEVAILMEDSLLVLYDYPLD